MAATAQDFDHFLDELALSDVGRYERNTKIYAACIRLEVVEAK